MLTSDHIHVIMNVNRCVVALCEAFLLPLIFDAYLMLIAGFVLIIV